MLCDSANFSWGRMCQWHICLFKDKTILTHPAKPLFKGICHLTSKPEHSNTYSQRRIDRERERERHKKKYVSTTRKHPRTSSQEEMVKAHQCEFLPSAPQSTHRRVVLAVCQMRGSLPFVFSAPLSSIQASVSLSEHWNQLATQAPSNRYAVEHKK